MHLLAISDNLKCGAQWPSRFYAPGRHICRVVHAESSDLPVEVASELRDVRIVGIQDGKPTGGKRLNQLILGPRDCSDRIKKLEVNRRDHGYHPTVGLRQLGQLRDLTRMRHAYLDDRQLMLRFELQ